MGKVIQDVSCLDLKHHTGIGKIFPFPVWLVHRWNSFQWIFCTSLNIVKSLKKFSLKKYKNIKCEVRDDWYGDRVTDNRKHMQNMNSLTFVNS